MFQASYPRVFRRRVRRHAKIDKRPRITGVTIQKSMPKLHFGHAMTCCYRIFEPRMIASKHWVFFQLLHRGHPSVSLAKQSYEKRTAFVYLLKARTDNPPLLGIFLRQAPAKVDFGELHATVPAKTSESRKNFLR